LKPIGAITEEADLHNGRNANNMVLIALHLYGALWGGDCMDYITGRYFKVSVTKSSKLRYSTLQ